MTIDIENADGESINISISSDLIDGIVRQIRGTLVDLGNEPHRSERESDATMRAMVAAEKQALAAGKSREAAIDAVRDELQRLVLMLRSLKSAVREGFDYAEAGSEQLRVVFGESATALIDGERARHV